MDFAFRQVLDGGKWVWQCRGYELHIFYEVLLEVWGWVM